MAISTGYIEVMAERDRGEWVHVHPDLRFPRYAYINVTDDDRSALDVHLLLVFDPAAARYVVDSLTARRRDPASSVDGTALRTIPVQEYMRSLEWSAKIFGTDDSVPHPFPPKLAQMVKDRGPSDTESLRWLARVYVVAHALSQPPAKAVQEAFRMPAPTASVWIRRARDRGLLPEVPDLAATHMSDEDFELSKLALRDG